MREDDIAKSTNNESKLNYITFKQFIYTINTRDCYEGNEGTICDNQVIRLVFDTNREDDYIELGWYDFYNKDTVWNTLVKTLNKNILESIVTDFRYSDKFNCIIAYLNNENEVESLPEYKN